MVNRKTTPPTNVSVPEASWSWNTSSISPSLWPGGRNVRRNSETVVNGSSWRSTSPNTPAASRSSGSSVTCVLNAMACAHRKIGSVMSTLSRPDP